MVTYLREITLPDNSCIDFKMVKDGDDKWRANKIILGKRHDLRHIKTWIFLVESGLNIRSFLTKTLLSLFI